MKKAMGMIKKLIFLQFSSIQKAQSDTLIKQVDNINTNQFIKLPKTSFNPRFHASSQELELKDDIGYKLYEYQQQLNLDRTFVLHESPIGINQEMHIGHFYNKTIKDIICRYKLLRGHKIYNSFGFDCYGPQVEHAALSADQNLKSMEYDEKKIRQLCQLYVMDQVKKYMVQLNRWGLMSDWRQSYFTFSNTHTKNVLNIKVYLQVKQKDSIYSQHKTILWSIARQAQVDLDQININYLDKPAVFIKLQVINEKDTFFLAFTSEPWTLTASHYLGINPDVEYAVLINGNYKYVLSKDFLKKHREYFKINNYTHFGTIRGSALQNKTFQHPLFDDQIVKIFQDPELVPSIGTGIQILCPAHFLDDLDKMSSSIYQKVLFFDSKQVGHVDEDGNLSIGEFKDLNIINQDASKTIIQKLEQQQQLLKIVDSVSSVAYTHKNTKEIIILRTIPSLFCSLDETDIEMFLDKIQKNTRNHQDKSNKIYAEFSEIIKSKSQGWCITSKQVWGIPIPVFIINDHQKFTKLLKQLNIKNKIKSEESLYFTNRDIIQHCSQLFEQHSQEIWWDWSVEDLLPVKFQPLAQVLNKRLDLVFDNQFVTGCSWLNLMKNRTSTNDGEIGQKVDTTEFQQFPSSIAIEGKDQNEQWLFSTAMISILTFGDPFFTQLITHPVIPSNNNQEVKLSKLSKDPVTLEDLIEGSMKINQTRQYGNGVDILRAVVATMTYSMDQSYSNLNKDFIKFRVQEINIVRKCYWKMIGCLDGYEQTSNVDLNNMSFINQFMYHQLITYVINITGAYEQMEYQKAYELYIDFIKSYVQDIFVDATRNNITTQYQSKKAQESLFLYNKIITNTLLTISPILPFNAQNIYKHLKDEQIFHKQWPKIPQSHMDKVQINIIRMNHLYNIRKNIIERIDESQQRIHQTSIGKRIQVVFILETDYEEQLIKMMGDDASEFLGVGKVTCEDQFSIKARKNSSALSSFKISNSLQQEKINIQVKLYLLDEVQCPRCLNFTVQKGEQQCLKCDQYVDQIDKGKIPQQKQNLEIELK